MRTNASGFIVTERPYPSAVCWRVLNAKRRGQVLNSNFHDNPLLRQSECPDLEVQLVDGGSPTPGGVGETSLPSVIPAVLNALFRATGQRVRELPVQALTA